VLRVYNARVGPPAIPEDQGETGIHGDGVHFDLQRQHFTPKDRRLSPILRQKVQ
jgi:hypothetical protein